MELWQLLQDSTGNVLSGTGSWEQHQQCRVQSKLIHALWTNILQEPEMIPESKLGLHLVPSSHTWSHFCVRVPCAGLTLSQHWV